MTTTVPFVSNGADLAAGSGSQVSARIRESAFCGSLFSGQHNIADHAQPGGWRAAGPVAARSRSARGLVDIDNDHSTHETAERVAKMYLQEVFKGRYHQQPKVASFPNVKELDEIYTVGRSPFVACSHHFVPIMGNCWIGIKPVPA